MSGDKQDFDNMSIEDLQQLTRISREPNNQRLFTQQDCDDISDALEKKMEGKFYDWAVELEKEENE